MRGEERPGQTAAVRRFRRGTAGGMPCAPLPPPQGTQHKPPLSPAAVTRSGQLKPGCQERWACIRGKVHTKGALVQAGAAVAKNEVAGEKGGIRPRPAFTWWGEGGGEVGGHGGNLVGISAHYAPSSH